MLNRRLRFELYFFILLLLYKIFFEISYIYGVYPFFGYYGFRFDFSMQKYFVGVIITIFLTIPPIIAFLKRGRNSDYISALVGILYFIPAFSFYGLANASDGFFYYQVIYWILWVALQKKVPFPKKRFQIPNSDVIFHILVFIIATVVLFVSGYYARFRIHLSLQEIYTLRLEVREISMPNILLYLFSFSNTLIPIALIYYISKKRTLMGWSLFFIQLLSFSFNGKKSVLFITLIAVAIGYVYSSKINIWRYVPLLFAALGLTIILEIFIGTHDLSTLITRRVCYMPTMLGQYYYEFFSSNEKIYLRESVLRWFGAQPPYDLPSTYIIGMYYFDNPETNANAGLCADAFKNFGNIGVVIYPILFCGILRLFDLCSDQINKKVITLICVMYAVKFTNANFFTMLLTGGYLLTCCMLYILPREKADTKLGIKNILRCKNV